MLSQFEIRACRAISCLAGLVVLAGCGSSATTFNSSAQGGSTVANTTTSGGTGGGGTGGIAPAPPPIVVSAPWTNARVAEGDLHSCLIDTSGGVWCWGRNANGQLGNGTTTDGKFVGRASILTSGVQAIAAGGNHTCALDSARGVWCWGANESGQLGNGNTTDSHVPVQVIGLSSGVQALAVGFQHSCAIDGSGVVWCWGSNAYGQLGNGTTTSVSNPVPTAGFAGGAKALSLGYYHSCATDTVGGLLCWGNNGSGRLGDGTTSNRVYPTTVKGLASGIQAVAAGYTHTCAVDASGAVKCWGANTYGQLGDGSTVSNSSPVTVTGLTVGVQTLAVGGYHSCVTDATSVVCWGYGKYGQLGQGAFASQPSPTPVVGASGPIRGLALGGFHSCALDAVGVQCWGSDYYEQLGDGTYTDSNTPVAVYNVSPPAH